MGVGRHPPSFPLLQAPLDILFIAIHPFSHSPPLSTLLFRYDHAPLSREVMSVRPSVRPSQVIFEQRIWLYECVSRVKSHSSRNILNNGTISVDEGDASDVPPRDSCSEKEGLLLRWKSVF